MAKAAILTLNAGSSSIKFGVYTANAEPDLLAVGQVSNLGPAAVMEIEETGQPVREQALGTADHAVALRAILDEARDALDDRWVAAVGHRVVHGGAEYAEPKRLDLMVMAKLHALEPLAPLHQPHNLNAVRAAMAEFPDAPQVACFDTAFHRGHPWVNDTFALPRRYYDQGVRRYGFHGLSYDYITGYLQTHHPDLAAGKVVVAHLGNGASMCAIKNGQSIGSTMGFSALDGLPMGTRCGQLDPGALLYLMRRDQLSVEQLTELLYRESGMKGLSGITHDMRTLEASDDPAAAQALDYYVFRIRRELGAMAAVLGGLDGLVFCGGVGENSVNIRARVCEDMDWLGISIDVAGNAANQLEIGQGRTRVLAIPTDEERVIARAASRFVAA
ncbi:MAG: acetate/propionate family kinase [Burkholderiaceae bacterium]